MLEIGGQKHSNSIVRYKICKKNKNANKVLMLKNDNQKH